MRLKLFAILLLTGFALPSWGFCSKLEHSLIVGTGEEYNSNVNEKASAKPEWTTILSANGTASYESARITASGIVDGTYNFYALGNRQDEFKGSASAKSTVTVVQDFLYAEGEDLFSQVYNNLGRGETNPTDSTRQQTNQNIVIGRAYITPHVGERLSLKLGYEFKAVMYDKSAQNKQTNMIFAKTGYDLTPKFHLLFDTDGSRLDGPSGWYERVVLSGGFKYEYMEKGILQVKAGPSFTRYDTGSFVLDPFWEAGITHAFDRLTLSIDTSSVYSENPVTRYNSRKTAVGGKATWQMDRLALNAGTTYSALGGEDTQQSEQISLTAGFTYDLTPKLVLKANGTQAFSTTGGKSQTRWYADGSLTYEIKNEFYIEGYYKWKLSGSSQGGDNNYQVNIVGLRLKKTF